VENPGSEDAQSFLYICVTKDCDGKLTLTGSYSCELIERNDPNPPIILECSHSNFVDQIECVDDCFLYILDLSNPEVGDIDNCGLPIPITFATSEERLGEFDCPCDPNCCEEGCVYFKWDLLDPDKASITEITVTPAGGTPTDYTADSGRIKVCEDDYIVFKVTDNGILPNPVPPAPVVGIVYSNFYQTIGNGGCNMVNPSGTSASNGLDTQGDYIFYSDGNEPAIPDIDNSGETYVFAMTVAQPLPDTNNCANCDAFFGGNYGSNGGSGNGFYAVFGFDCCYFN
jgi:hypothetical protein